MGKAKVRRRRGNSDRLGSRKFWIYGAERAAHRAAALVVAAGATVGVAALEQDDDAALVLDAPAEGVLDRSGVGVWTFDGTAGTVVSVHVDASDFDAVAYLWSPTGELVGTADEGGATTTGMALDGPLVADLPLPGRYRIEAELLLNRGANIEAVNSFGQTPLHIAVHSVPWFLELVELLLNRGANVEAVDDNGETPLHYAAHGGPRRAKLELVELLLNRGASVEAMNSDGETPLDVATNSKVVDLLSNR